MSDKFLKDFIGDPRITESEDNAPLWKGDEWPGSGKSTNIIAQGFNISQEPECVGVDIEDGNRPIWRKWYYCPSMPNAGTISIAHELTGLRKIFPGNGMMTNGNHSASLAYPTPGNGYYRVYIQDGSIWFNSTHDGTLYKVWIDIYYTLEDEENLGSIYSQLPKLPNILQPGVEHPSNRLYQLETGNYKPTYLQTVNLGEMKNFPTNANQDFDLATLIPGIESVVHESPFEKAWGVNSSSKSTVPFPYPQGNISSYWYGSGLTFRLNYVGNYTTYTAYAVVEYTKTTDAPIDASIVGPVVGSSVVSMCPDYANAETINRIPTNNGTWTVERDGYIHVEAQRTASAGGQYIHAELIINGYPMMISTLDKAYNASTLRVEGVYQVAKGDVVQLNVVGLGTFKSCACFFIPSRLVSTVIVAGGSGENADLSNYYDKDEINDLLSNISPGGGTVDAWTKTEADSRYSRKTSELNFDVSKNNVSQDVLFIVDDLNLNGNTLKDLYATFQNLGAEDATVSFVQNSIELYSVTLQPNEVQKYQIYPTSGMSISGQGNFKILLVAIMEKDNA